eukprot:11548600-Karenia_brevis.AAC.1
MLEFLKVPLWLILACMRSVVGCVMHPFINGDEGPGVACERGVRQGRADSMKIFCCIVCWLLEPLIQSWHRNGFGVVFSGALRVT